MENENDKNYLERRKDSSKNNILDIDSKNEIKSGPKKELLGSSGDTKEPENGNNEIVDMIEKKKNKDMTIPIVLGVILLIAIVVIGFLFLNNNKEEKPEAVEEIFQQKILNSSVKAMDDIETYSFDGKVRANISSELGDLGDAELVFDIAMAGKMDQSDINNPKADCNLKMNVDVLTEGGSQELSVDFDAMSFGQKKAYYRLNDYDLGAIEMKIGLEFSKYKGKWYLLDIDEMESMEGMEDLSFSSGMYDLTKIKDIYSKYNILKFEEDLGDSCLGGYDASFSAIEFDGTGCIDTYHYQAKLDSKAIISLYLEILKEMEKEDESKSLDEVISEIEEGVEKYNYVINEVVNNINIEVWIGKSDNFIYRTKLSGKFDEEFVKMIEDEMIKKGDIMEEDRIDGLEKKDILIDLDIDVSMSDFNEPVEINEPESAENLMKVFEEIAGRYLLGTLALANGDSDKDNLSDEMEVLYGTDPNNPDTDGDGHSDGDEVAGGYDPLLPGETKLDYDRLFKN